MKFEILSEKENPLMKRREMIFSLDYEGKSTASKEELKKSIAEQFKVDLEKVDVSKILSEVGKSRGQAWIKIYEGKVPVRKKKEKGEKGGGGKEGEKAKEQK